MHFLGVLEFAVCIPTNSHSDANSQVSKFAFYYVRDIATPVHLAVRLKLMSNSYRRPNEVVSDSVVAAVDGLFA